MTEAGATIALVRDHRAEALHRASNGNARVQYHVAEEVGLIGRLFGFPRAETVRERWLWRLLVLTGIVWLVAQSCRIEDRIERGMIVFEHRSTPR